MPEEGKALMNETLQSTQTAVSPYVRRTFFYFFIYSLGESDPQ